MAKKELHSPEVLRQLLRYEPDTGKLFWQERTPEHFSTSKVKAEHACARWNTTYSGLPAFTARTKGGYLHGSVGKKTLAAHRVVFAIMSGRWPDNIIDHINGRRDDNRWANLREATYSQNSMNSLGECGTSQYRGVSWSVGMKKWLALLTFDGVPHRLGFFDCEHEAAEAWNRKASALFGVYARLNVIRSPNHNGGS